jgi:hypothetical protein
MSKNTSIKEAAKLCTPNSKNQKEILNLATQFNKITDSDRPLIPDFYDCGTTARAIFMQLIKKNRNGEGLQEYELPIIKSYYQSPCNYGISNRENLDEAIQTLKTMNDGIMIISIRFWYSLHPQRTQYETDTHGPTRVLQQDHKIKIGDKSCSQFGHVFVIEKKSGKYYLFQSALNTYTLLDYLAANSYEPQIDAVSMLKGFYPLIETDTWTIKEKKQFMRDFAFAPSHPLNSRVRPELFWAVVEY